MKSGLKITDRTARFVEALDVLAGTSVMVGVPQGKDNREDGKIGNAEIGYLMENGIPEQNVPARPHLVPGVRRARAQTAGYLKQAGRLAFEGRPEGVTRAYMAAGQAAVNSVKEVIREGVPPPLSERTLRARAARGRKGAKLELANRAAGKDASTALAKPLIDTGQYLAAQTYVLKREKTRFGK